MINHHSLLNYCCPDNVEFHKSLGRRIQDNMSVMCAYDISKIDNEYLRTVMSSYNYIIFDQPLVIYKIVYNASGQRESTLRYITIS
jgi:hypothetical protein